MNSLTKLKEFKKVLDTYAVSPANQTILHQTNFVVITGPSSAGRNTTIRELLKTGEYHFIISDTTRKPRINDGVLEQNGVEYWFREEEDVLADLKGGRFLEAELIHGQQVSGISIRELAIARDQQKIAITDVDLGGIQTIAQTKPDTIAVFMLPPSFEEWQKRLDGRGVMADEERRRRLETALTIFAAALEHDNAAIVINETIEGAAQEVHQLAKQGIVDTEKQARGRRVAEQLYIETKLFLGK